MGHRALVARERADGRHDVHRSQWGGADLSLARSLARGEWPPPTTRDPVASGVTWVDLLGDHLDPLVHEALFVATHDGPVRAYRPLWLGADREQPGGLLVGVDWAARCDDARVRSWFAGARAVAREASRRDVPDHAAAAAILEGRLREWAGDREVVRLP